MKPLTKCLLLPIDGSKESLKPVEFLRRLYTDLTRIRVVVCYFLPALSPIYRGKPDSPEMAKKRTETLRIRETETRSIMNMAREVLLKAGFPEESCVEHIQEKGSSLSRDVCLVAGFKKADALIMQKQTHTSLESLLKDDPIQTILQHCAASPIWLIEGNVDPSRAAICILNEDTSLRAADHAAFMLAETRTEIVLLHASRGVTRPMVAPAFDPGAAVERWLTTSEGRAMEHYIVEAKNIIRKEGITEERVKLNLIPARGNVALEIVQYCRNEGIGIVVIGHSNPTGKWSFLKGSVTKKALAEFKDMAVWVNQ